MEDMADQEIMELAEIICTLNEEQKQEILHFAELMLKEQYETITPEEQAELNSIYAKHNIYKAGESALKTMP